MAWWLLGAVFWTLFEVQLLIGGPAARKERELLLREGAGSAGQGRDFGGVQE